MANKYQSGKDSKMTNFFNITKKISFPYKALIILMQLLVISIIVLVVKNKGFTITPLHFYHLSTSTVGVYQDRAYENEKRLLSQKKSNFVDLDSK